MGVQVIHQLHKEIQKFKTIQAHFRNQISLENIFFDKGIKFCGGVDVAYWKEGETEWEVCSIVIIDYETKALVEKTYSTGIINVPYVPGYLAFRELPLIIKAAKRLSHTPDLFMFDGNGYLHPRHMGIATHASFYLHKPTIGIAKSYLKIQGNHFIMPGNETSSYEDIIVEGDIYGRVLRTRKNVKPIFISCGNYIDLQTTTEITLNLINEDSRLPIPVRLADLESKRLRKQKTRGCQQ
jgi:deoxyribonuclease V